MDTTLWIAAMVAAFVAGTVKGAVGFAMPMIMISTLGSFLPPQIAVAALILPTVTSNLLQALRQGVGPAVASAKAHWRYILLVALMILFSAQLVGVLPDRALFLMLGIPLTAFALVQLIGWRPRIAPAWRRVAETVIALVAGFVGGLSGVWGPPTVLYLTALETPKIDSIRVQGVVYGLGSLTLLVAHLQSGVLNAATAPLSALLVAPAMAGMFAGFAVQDRLDQEKFRRATLAVLVIASLNLIRRGLTV